MKPDRINWIDVARGIGIILVVYGHAISSHGFRYLIYAFHMPLFFFLSGLVFTYRKEIKVTAFLQKNAGTILLPYLLFALLSYGLWLVTKHPSNAEQLKQFLSILYGNGNNNLLAFNNILWFLPCLFLTRFLFYLLLRFSNKTYAVVILMIVLSILGYGYSLFFASYKLVFGLETALTAIVFFGTGYLWKSESMKVKKILKNKLLLVILISLSLCILFGYLNYREYGYQIDLRQDRLNNYFYFYISAFAGITAILALSQLVSKNKLLEYLGRNTLVLFAWHLLLFSYITRFLHFTGLTTFINVLPPFASPVLYSIAAIVIILLISTGIRSGRGWLQMRFRQ
jgi:acyltransferase